MSGASAVLLGFAQQMREPEPKYTVQGVDDPFYAIVTAVDAQPRNHQSLRRTLVSSCRTHAYLSKE